MAEKIAVTRGDPCHICGKPDYCYRLIHEDGTTEHCCARVGESAVSNQFGAFILNREKETTIGNYYCYKTPEDKEKSKAAWALAHGYKPKNGSATPLKPSLPKTQPTATKKVEEVAPASAERIDKVLRTFMEILMLEDYHEKSLRADWNTDATKGLYENIIKSYPIKSLPPADWIRKGKKFRRKLKNRNRSSVMYELQKRVGTPEGVPGFYLNKYDRWDIAGTEGILFPTFNESGLLTSLRLREDFPLIKGSLNETPGTYKHAYEEGADVWYFKAEDGDKEVPVYEKPKGKPAGKYKAFSSTGYNKGCGNGSHYSLYAPNQCDYTKVYVTEGEKKAMVASELLGCPCVSLPGVGTFRLMFESPLVDYLKSKGMKQAIIAYDADKGENIRVLQAEQAAVQEFIKNGIQIAIGEWNANWGKGLDDTLVQGLRPNIYLVQ